MSAIRILNAEPYRYSEIARATLREVGELTEATLDHAGLVQAVADFDVLITRLGLAIDREVLDAGSRLRAVVTPTTGLDHVDVDHAEARGITVLSLRGETEFLKAVPATAEHTWALLLALVRRIPAASMAVRAGEWDRDRFRGNELRGKTLGLLGVGRVGRQVAGYGLAFGMAVQGYDPDPGARADGVVPRATMADVLQSSDVVSLHVPLSAATTHLIGTRELALLQPRAILVNTSRGAVVDSTALLRALEDGHLGGAALDVLEGELAIASGEPAALVEYARRSDRLLITPHIAGATVESMERTEILMARKLQRFVRSGVGGNDGGIRSGG